MSGSNTRASWMPRLALSLLLALSLSACSSVSQPPIVVQPPKLPAPDVRWMKTPELPPNCATWSECAQQNISAWEKSLTDTGAI